MTVFARSEGQSLRDGRQGRVSEILDKALEGERISEQLTRSYFDLHRIDESDAVSFNLPYGEWIRLFGEHGLEVDALVELRAPEGADPDDWHYMAADWARRWPSENIWKVRKQVEPVSGSPV